MSDKLAEQTRNALDLFPKIDGETQEAAVELLEQRLEDDASASDDGVILDHALEDAGVPREERLCIVDELTDIN